MLKNIDKNKNPFKVPENYFEGLTQDVMNSLPPQEKQGKKVSLWKKVLPWTGVAAVIAVVVVTVSTFGKMPEVITQDEKGSQNAKMYQQTIAYNDVEDYFLFLEDESTEAEYIDVLFEEL